eukprot:6198790-Pleurochrysis_carterae.AAC.1
MAYGAKRRSFSIGISHFASNYIHQLRLLISTLAATAPQYNFFLNDSLNYITAARRPRTVRFGRWDRIRPSGSGGESLAIYDTTECCRGADAGAGAGRTCVVAPAQGRGLGGVYHARGDPNLGERSAERSASTHAARVHSGKPCMRIKKSSALRQFQIQYFARRNKRHLFDATALSATVISMNNIDIATALMASWNRSKRLRGKQGQTGMWKPLNIKQLCNNRHYQTTSIDT